MMIPVWPETIDCSHAEASRTWPGNGPLRKQNRGGFSASYGNQLKCPVSASTPKFPTTPNKSFRCRFAPCRNTPPFRGWTVVPQVNEVGFRASVRNLRDSLLGAAALAKARYIQFFPEFLKRMWLSKVAFLFQICVLVCSSQVAPSHRIAVRTVNGVGQFYVRDTGSTFIPRGNTFLRLAEQTRTAAYGGSSFITHSLFNVGLYDSSLGA
jgi:hypothetical protein